eukprot:CAMPEP_0203807994 /NCGR_PEP_ID=MMETSP0115-20131106/1366_1 /ASSEMBLY_ACC=CAM_ASM_000227 /TAXON_ID=33651 /ORGANISM="Bicosoecid sp, Strain ms1" /LENGTH=71 /DNA_ID=CAMNT_0050716677 /DNA_START=74 /DNA_END=286 /DNA_ORIENTATION=+
MASEVPETMRAVQYADYGGPDALEVATIPVPPMAPTDVVIEVHAAGTNPVDAKLTAGYIKAWPQALPIVPG